MIYQLLKPSDDRKVRNRAGHYNSFGLMRVATCPGRTRGRGGCCWKKNKNNKVDVCYVDKLLKVRPKLKKLLEHNTKILKKAGPRLKRTLLKQMFASFLSKEYKRGDGDINFRMHWSGDVFSKTYASALTDAMLAFPDINFWMYSRSFDFLEPLLAIKNLSLYVSCDDCNYRAAVEFMKKNKRKSKCRLNIAYMGESKKTGDMVPCPVDSGDMAYSGACHKCKICLKGEFPVWFKTR